MSGQAAFRGEQRGVARGMAAALVVTLAAMLAGWWVGQGAASPPGEALLFALRADAVVLAWLAATIGNVARMRFFSPADIAGSEGGTDSLDVRRASAIVQNTLEQALLALGAHLAVAATFAFSDALVIALVGLFSVGRAAFWIGYARGARARAFGFGLTFYPSVLALAACLVANIAG